MRKKKRQKKSKQSPEVEILENTENGEFNALDTPDSFTINGHTVTVDNFGNAHYKTREEQKMEMRLKISKLIIESQKFKITERMLKISESKVRKIFKSICQLYEIGMKTSKIDDENTKMIFLVHQKQYLKQIYWASFKVSMLETPLLKAKVYFVISKGLKRLGWQRSIQKYQKTKVKNFPSKKWKK